MAEKKNSFPIMPIANWWAVRNKFKQSIPSIVSSGYVATVLNMQEKSAKNNIINPLVDLGIIDQDGKPLERANKWRDDLHYPEVCQEILVEIYPRELLEALPGPKIDREAAKRWFALNTGLGEVAVGRMTAFYELLITADPLDSQTPINKNTSPKKVPANKKAQSVKKIPVPKPLMTKIRQDQDDDIFSNPSIHLDIQIHISPDSTLEQIDSIFASMAKHLYKK